MDGYYNFYALFILIHTRLIELNDDSHCLLRICFDCRSFLINVIADDPGEGVRVSTNFWTVRGTDFCPRNDGMRFDIT